MSWDDIPFFRLEEKPRNSREPASLRQLAGCLASPFPYTRDLEITNDFAIFPRITLRGPFEVSLQRGLVKDRPQAVILMPLTVPSHTSFTPSVNSQSHTEGPVSFRRTTQRRMQNNRWSGKAIDIQKEKRVNVCKRT